MQFYVMSQWNIVKFKNFLAASDRPFNMNLEQRKTNLLRYMLTEFKR